MNPEPQPPPADPSKPRAPYRAKGKIASLSKPQREMLNQMLLDGNTYAEVVRKMAELGVSLNIQNVSNWHNGPGYQRWVLDQEWLEDMRADQESGLDVLPQVDAGKFNEAALQVAITQLFRAVRHIGSGQLKEKLGGDPQGFARLVNALARACRETNNLQKYRDAAAKAVAAELKRLDPTRELSDREDELITQRMDDFFLKPRRRRKADDEAQSPSSSVKSTTEDKKTETGE